VKKWKSGNVKQGLILEARTQITIPVSVINVSSVIYNIRCHQRLQWFIKIRVYPFNLCKSVFPFFICANHSLGHQTKSRCNINASASLQQVYGFVDKKQQQ